jgi:hypothetical protein
MNMLNFYVMQLPVFNVCNYVYFRLILYMHFINFINNTNTFNSLQNTNIYF